MPHFIAAPEVASCYALIRCETATDSQRLERALNRNGVGSRHWYGGGLRGHSYLSGLEHEGLTVTERLADRLVGLPTAPDLSANEIMLIADTLNAAIGREARD